MKILIFGANGMLGHDLVRAFKDFESYSYDKKELDITDKQALLKELSYVKPDIAINAAAYTDVDGSESNYELAYNINSIGVKYVGEACEKINCVLLHISTDYVFDGIKNGYMEDDEPNPISAYGKSKYLGEKYLKLAASKFYIVRTSWLYGIHGANFVNKVLSIAKNKKLIEVVNDQSGNPTYTKDLSEAIKNIVMTKPDFGIYHLTNDGQCTWFEFAQKIIEFEGLKVEVKPITSSQLKRAAKRPKCSGLINTKLPKLRRWENALMDYLKEYERN